MTAVQLASSDLNTLPSQSSSTHPPIRSFVKRCGRLTIAQAHAIQTLGAQFCIPFVENFLSFEEIFLRNAPTILEIGFGMGDATAQIARQYPEKNFLGVEVHTPGIGNLLKLIDQFQLTNCRIIQFDAVEVLKKMIPPLSLAGVHIFFPDPWHKKRHQKRRLIQAAFVEQLCSRMRAGAYLHCATDWQDYATQMRAVLSGHTTLVGSTGFIERPPSRPPTKFEQRGVRLGHSVWDLLFYKSEL